LYFVPEWLALDSGVLHSQILTQAGYLAQNGFECFFVGSEISKEQAAKAEELIGERYGVASKVFGCYSQKLGFVGIYRTIRTVSKLAREAISDFRPTHVYTRGYPPSFWGRKIAREQGALSVYHIRGERSAEVALEHGKGLRPYIVRLLDLMEIRRSDRLACVSHRLKEWVEEEAGREDVEVIPCCIDENENFFDPKSRADIRRQYGFNEENKVICYVGGLSMWQRISDILRLCKRVSHLRDKYRFLFVVSQADLLAKMIQETSLPIKKCGIISCSHSEVAKYMSAADAGIIMRHDIVVNNVASPIKIGEYLGCGLGVIMTKGIGDYSKMVSDAGVGIMLDESSNVAEQVINFMEKTDFDQLRYKAIAFACENLSWDSHIDGLKRLFSVDTE
jgi:glycosyltransferase involved in cell wall biosynthesis